VVYLKYEYQFAWRHIYQDLHRSCENLKHRVMDWQCY
jgi:hypothetical protein